MTRYFRMRPHVERIQFGVDGSLLVVSLYDINAYFLRGNLIAVGSDRNIRVKYSPDIAEKMNLLAKTHGLNKFRPVSRGELERTYQEMIAKRSLAYMDAILTGKEDYSD